MSMDEIWLWLITHTTDPMILVMLAAVNLVPFENIVNVQWSAGLAVEFAPGKT